MIFLEFLRVGWTVIRAHKFRSALTLLSIAIGTFSIVLMSSVIGAVVGIGMKTESGIAAQMFRILSDNGINIQMISTSPIRISCVVAEDLVDKAVEVLHEGLRVGQEDGI